MSTVIAKNVQVGTSGTSTDNFTIFQPATPDGTLRIGNGNTGITTSQVAVTSAGNVGIGTSSPASQLDVSKTGDATLSVTSAGVQRYQLIARSGGNFEVYDQSNAATRITLTQAGNVGIGTSSPGGKLAVVGSSSATLGSLVQFTISGGQGFYFNANSTGTLNTLAVGSGENLAFNIGSTEQARITSAGLFQFNSGYGSVATAYGCRAWVNFNGTGTVAIRGSGNVSSITDGGVGIYTVNYTTALPDANYSVVGMTGYLSSGDSGHTSPRANAISTSSTQVLVLNDGDALVDVDVVCISVFR